MPADGKSTEINHLLGRRPEIDTERKIGSAAGSFLMSLSIMNENQNNKGIFTKHFLFKLVYNIKTWGSSPNSLKAKEFVFSEFPVISWARKESHLAGNHEAPISPHRWRGSRLFLRGSLLPPPLRFADDRKGVHGKRISRRCLLRDLAFLPVPWLAFMKNSINEFGDRLVYTLLTANCLFSILPIAKSAFLSIHLAGKQTRMNLSESQSVGWFFSLRNPPELGKGLIHSWPKPKERKNRWTDKH